MKQIISFLVIVLTFLASSTSSFECGQRKITFSGYWPWQVAVYHRKGSSQDSYTCGGSLISETFVLTAARCVQSDDGDGRRMFVRMGVRNLQELDPNGFQQHGVREIHRVDRATGLGSGVALLELDSEVEFTEYVQPVCLNLAEELVEQVGSFVSWGDESSGLKSSISEVISDEECLRSDLQVYEEVRGSSMFCVGFKTETTLCNSDAGSGIYFKRKGVWFMGGTLAARDSGSSCSAKSNAAFNNIENFVPWIRNVTKIQYSTEKLGKIQSHWLNPNNSDCFQIASHARLQPTSQECASGSNSAKTSTKSLRVQPHSQSTITTSNRQPASNRAYFEAFVVNSRRLNQSIQLRP